MSEAADPIANPPGEFLQVAIDHTLGELWLQIEFALTSPWTILFGPSGAGKTSLLRVLGGLTRPNSGHIVLNDQTLLARSLEKTQETWTPPARRGIGFVTQRPTLFPHMSVTDNVAFGLSGMSRRAAGERVTEMLTLFHADHLAGRSPAELSGGELQRVALARALAPGPRMLLLDEPFAGLDADLKREILEQLSTHLTERSVPALYVSHDVAEAFHTRADVLVMDKGKIQDHGPAHVVLAGRRLALLRQLGASF